MNKALLGDTNFESCLLTADFTSISRKGKVRVLADELAVAAKNKGKNLPIPSFAKITVLMHGNLSCRLYNREFNGPPASRGGRSMRTIMFGRMAPGAPSSRNKLKRKTKTTEL